MKKRLATPTQLAKLMLSLTLMQPLLGPAVGPASAAAAAQPAITVRIDGQLQTYDQPPLILHDRVMVPLRGIFEALGAQVEWHAKTRLITAVKGGIEVRLTLGDTTVWINNTPVYSLGLPPEIRNDRVLVPIRFISELFGADVGWDSAKRTVLIQKDKMRLFEAIDAGDQQAVAALLKGGIDPDTNAFGDNAVGYALSKGNWEAVKLLLQQGGDKQGARISIAIQGMTGWIKPYLTNFKNSDATRAPADEQFLFWSTTTNKTETVKALLELGTDPNAKKALQSANKEIAMTPLSLTFTENNLEILHELLEAGADPNWPVNPGNNLHDYLLIRPAAFNKIAMLRDLLDHGADPNLQDHDGWTPLMAAADNGSVAATKLLLAHHADPNLKNQGGATALMIAQAHGNSQIAQTLLAAGAKSDETKVSPYALNRYYGDKLQGLSADWTPLMKAAYLGDTAQVKNLLAAGADPNAASNQPGSPTAFSLALQNGNTELIQAFLSGKTPIPQKYKNMLLFSAVYTGNLELAQLALQHGADINAKSDPKADDWSGWSGEALLLWVSEHNNLEMLDFLLQNGIDPQGIDLTPVWVAARNGNATATIHLLTAITDDALRQSQGGDALVIAARYGNIETVRTLLAFDINANYQNDQGATPLSTAKKAGFQDIVDVLTQAGATE